MSVKKRLLIVDDDDDLRVVLVEQFALYDEFETDDVATATEAIAATKAKDYDLILLDVDLPDMLGTEACQLMRKAGVGAPIVMLTGNDGDMNEILGLNSGANDYITKPFRFAVMLARLRRICGVLSKAKTRYFKSALIRSNLPLKNWNKRGCAIFA